MFSFNSKLEDVLKGSSAVGLECILSADGIYLYNYVVLKKERNRLVTDLSGSSLSSAEALKEVVKTDLPVFLVLNGKGIIHRKFPYSEGEGDISLLNKIFPAANLQDFYIQKVVADDQSRIVSVIRKSVADSVLSDLKKIGFQVIGCSLGPFCFQSLFPLLDNDSTAREVIVSGHKLSLSTDNISNFELSDVPGSSVMLTGGEVVKPELVTGFAAVAPYFLPMGQSVEANMPLVKESREEFRQMKIFKTAGLSALIFFVGLLLVNFIVFMQLSNKHNEYDEQVSMSQGLLREYETLKMEVGQKKSFLDRTGLLEASRNSFYADQIAMDIPGSILLSQMNIYPMKKKSGADEEDIAFTSGSILISGSCKKSTELNEWIGVLKGKNCIREVNIVNYTQDRSENTGAFSIALTMK